MDDVYQNETADELERVRGELEQVQGVWDRANAEFEEFVSMAAHNLRQSLREVASFSQLIAENYGGSFDSEGRMFLDKVQEGTASMQALLGDMVDYWAAGTCERPSRTDLEDVLRQTLLCAEQQITQRSAVVTHDPLPAVRGDFELLSKVLHHLLRNAIEYCGAPIPHVHVSARRADVDWVISVNDNGPGIEAALQSRVFLAFRRLHGKEYPGSGLGLAFCKKAVEWQGGRIWLDSTPGAGSTFHFSVPAAD